MTSSSTSAAYSTVVSALSRLRQCAVGPLELIEDSGAVWAPHFSTTICGPWGTQTLVCRVEGALHPKRAHSVRLALADWQLRYGDNKSHAVVVAPYVSEASDALLGESAVGFVDEAGNYRIQFNDVFLERRVPGNPAREKRVVRPLFTPAAVRIIRVLLETPGPWKGYALAQQAGTSAAHVSFVRNALVNHGWAASDKEGLKVTHAAEILDAWRKAGSRPRPPLRGYVSHHGAALQARCAELMERDKGQNLVLAGASAAAYQAPYLRSPVLEVVATEVGVSLLRKELGFREVAQGANVLADVVEEGADPLRFAEEMTQGVFATDPLTTYLALCQRGERHAEAAEHLRTSLLIPRWKATGLIE